MLSIVFSFCAGAVVSLLVLPVISTRRRQPTPSRELVMAEREAALRAEIVDQQLRDALGQPQRPYFTAEAIADARRALEPLVVIKVKP